MFHLKDGRRIRGVIGGVTPHGVYVRNAAFASATAHASGKKEKWHVELAGWGWGYPGWGYRWALAPWIFIPFTLLGLAFLW